MESSMDQELEEIRKKKIQELQERAKTRAKAKQEENKPEPKIKVETSPVTLNSQNFDQFVKEKPIVLVDFWAEWCGPCRMVAPILDQLAEKYAGKVWVGKVNVDHNQRLAQKYGATSIPTFVAFKDGKPVSRFVGAQPKQAFDQTFKKLIKLEPKQN